MTLDIINLIPTQSGLRNPDNLPEMMAHIESGGLFDKERVGGFSRLIKIARFKEDNRFYIADGHHRLLSILLAGRRVVYSLEYTLTDWEYDEYNTIALENYWYTPFDPRHEVRLPDLGPFKSHINDMEYAGKSPYDIIKYIVANEHLFKTERKSFDLEHLLFFD